MFLSAAFRRSAIGLIALGAIVWISVGITKAQQRKQHELSEWEGMLAEDEEGQSGGPTIYQPVLPLEPNNPNIADGVTSVTANDPSIAEEEPVAEITPFDEKLRRNLDLNILQSVKNTNQFGMVDKVAGLLALPREFELIRGSRSK